MGEEEERNETDEKYMIQNEEEKKNPLDVVGSRSAPTNKKKQWMWDIVTQHIQNRTQTASVTSRTRSTGPA